MPITIKDSKGTVIKSFTEVGIANVETAILWIWRDLFVSLLATKNNKGFVKVIPDLVTEIDDVLNWRGLERLITGGVKRSWIDFSFLYLSFFALCLCHI